ncbi:OmpA family protein [Phenylobacterium sp.]|uniref:OmpA family protein n=1 Tax=Phenylobacterium sp. TaxID=1871053 RepID=UPI0035AEF0A7
MGGRNKSVLIAGALLLGAVSLGGCATKKYVNEQVGAVDTRVSAHDTRIADLDKTSREALERATAAGKLAEGKFLYEVVLSDDSVKFPLNKWALSPEAQSRLDALAEKLKGENKNVYVEIQGHTDATGSEEYNEQLGAERAEAVRKYLNRQGIALNRLGTISYGEDEPVAPNDTREGRAANRRVVLVVLS